MVFDRLKLIEASAGTGKTQELAKRLIVLLDRQIKPQELVALTFSRDAAGEIFERFVTLLAERAKEDKKYAQYLRSVIATQHLTQIGTIDAFLMKIVRAFPLEFGLMGKLEVLDKYRLARERSKVAFSILRATDERLKQHFVEAFAMAMDGADVASFITAYLQFIDKWHSQVIAKDKPSAWGEASVIWPDGAPLPIATTEVELARAAEAMRDFASSSTWLQFVEWVRNFRGSFDGASKGLTKKFLELDDLFKRDVLEVTYRNATYSFSRAQTAKIQEAFAAVFGYVVRQKMSLARGVYALITAYEKVYDRMVRSRGRLVFDDVPRQLAKLDQDKRLALEFRMDAKFAAWALDEFQDTSRGQWQAISNLIDEAKQDTDKSVLVVGDRKQAIYGWREGDVGIFEKEKQNGGYAHGELVDSWRYGKSIAEAVTRVFADGNLANEYPGWECPTHHTNMSKMADFVQIVETQMAESRNVPESFVQPIANALRAVDPVGRKLAAAVLVRGNKFGEMLSDALRRAGIENVVFEGDSAVAATVALAGFLDLVELADHPCDLPVYRHFAMTPLAAAKYPQGVPEVEELSREMAEAFTTRGLVRVFRELRALLPAAAEEAWSEYTERQYNEMLRAAAEFELTRDSDTRVADFRAFLACRSRRNLAEPGKIKIITIHRSKGLGFDYVILPLYESKGIESERGESLEGEDWILPDPGDQVTTRIEGLSEVREARVRQAIQETLCVYYVAMTRAKRALTVLLHPQAKEKSKVRRFSDIIRERLGGNAEIGDREWYLHLSQGKSDGDDKDRPPQNWERSEKLRRSQREKIRRRTPSKMFHSGMSAAELFAPMSKRKVAIERGNAAHEEYAKIEFWPEETARTPLEKAMGRPKGLIGLWREKPFEIFLNGEWTSGRFDRVVFTEVAGVRQAVIADYKTNRRRSKESDGEFAMRMKAAYAGQLNTYRQAVSEMTGIATDQIRCQLLTLADGGVIEW